MANSPTTSAIPATSSLFACWNADKQVPCSRSLTFSPPTLSSAPAQGCHKSRGFMCFFVEGLNGLKVFSHISSGIASTMSNLELKSIKCCRMVLSCQDGYFSWSALRASHLFLLGTHLRSFPVTHVNSWIARTEMRIQQLIGQAHRISESRCPQQCLPRLQTITIVSCSGRAMLIHPCKAVPIESTTLMIGSFVYSVNDDVTAVVVKVYVKCATRYLDVRGKQPCMVHRRRNETSRLHTHLRKELNSDS